mgnify:FL=1
MANTYEMKISNLERKVKDGDLDNVIYKIHYSFNATDGKSAPTTGRLHNLVSLAAPEPDNFVAFADVTEAKCIAWVLADLASQNPPTTESDMKAKVDAQIARKKVPVKVTGVPENWS